MYYRSRRGCLLALILVCLSGCIGPWRPSRQNVEAEPVGHKLDMAAYLSAERLGQRIYRRQELPRHEDRPPTIYVRRMTADRMVEGILLGRELLPIKSYLEPDVSPTTQPAAAQRPRAPLKGGTALLFELDEPLPSVPPELDVNKPIESTTVLRYYDYSGRRAGAGTLTRYAEIEGIEDIECPAGRFSDCLRVRVDLVVRLSWFLRMNGTGYVWLSPRVGEVRRVFHLSGWFMIFWFGSAYEYELVSYNSMEAQALSARPPAAEWSSGAVLFDRLLPHPQVAGMVVDFATSRPGP